MQKIFLRYTLPIICVYKYISTLLRKFHFFLHFMSSTKFKK